MLRQPVLPQVKGRDASTGMTWWKRQLGKRWCRNDRAGLRPSGPEKARCMMVSSRRRLSCAVTCERLYLRDVMHKEPVIWNEQCMWRLRKRWTGFARQEGKEPCFNYAVFSAAHKPPLPHLLIFFDVCFCLAVRYFKNLTELALLVQKQSTEPPGGWVC